MASTTVAVVPTWGHRDHLERFLPTLLEQTLPFARVVIVGDRGNETVVGGDPRVELRTTPDNRGFAGAVNRGIEHAFSEKAVDMVAVINDDVSLDLEWHAHADQAIRLHPGYGSCATCLLQLEQPEKVASAGIDWHPSGFARELLNGGPPPPATLPPREVWGASASAALFRRELFDSVGKFDESYFAYQEDVELALRARRGGWKCVMAPAARGLHLGFGSNRPFPVGGSYADFFNARNRLVLLVTTLPADDWRRHWRKMLVAQLRLLTTSLPEGRAGAVWAGVLHGLCRVPRALRARRQELDAFPPTTERGCS